MLSAGLWCFGRLVGKNSILEVFLILERGGAVLDWRKGGPRFGFRVLNE